MYRNILQDIISKKKFIIAELKKNRHLERKKKKREGAKEEEG